MSTTPTKRVTRRTTSESSPGTSVVFRRSETSPSSRQVEEIDERFRQQPLDIEIGVEGDDFEIGTEKRITQKGPRRAKRSPLETNAVNADLHKPFTEGWGREVLIYGKSGQNSTSEADVYYFSPEGKKLRSKEEVNNHLVSTKSPLSISYFTFKQQPIYEEPFEIVRYASKQKKKNKTKNVPLRRSSSTEKNTNEIKNTIDYELQSRERRGSISDDNHAKQHKRHSTETDLNIDTNLQEEQFVTLKSIENEKGKQSSVKDNSAHSKSGLESFADEKGSERLVTRSSKRRVSGSPLKHDAKSQMQPDVLKLRRKSTNDVVDIRSTKLSETSDASEVTQNNDDTSKSVLDKSVLDNVEADASDASHVFLKKYETSQKSRRKSLNSQNSSEVNVETVGIKSVESSVVVEEEASSESRTNGAIIGEIRVMSKPFGTASPDSVVDVAIVGGEPSADAASVTTPPAVHPHTENKEPVIVTMTSTGVISNVTDVDRDPEYVKSTDASPPKIVIENNSDGSIITKVKKHETSKKKMFINTKTWLKVRPKATDASTSVQSKSKNKSVLSATKTQINKAKTAKSNKEKPFEEGDNNKNDSIASESKRRRTSMLPARFRDFAVDSGKGEMESTESSGESSTDSMEGDGEPVVISPAKVATIPQEQAPNLHFISSTNPSAAEIIQSVLNRAALNKPRVNNVAKKRTGKRRLKAVEDAHVSKKPRVDEEQESNGGVNGEMRVCTLSCPLEPGIPPALQCQLCQCLFHPVCVNFNANPALFLCKSCLSSNKVTPSSNNSATAVKAVSAAHVKMTHKPVTLARSGTSVTVVQATSTTPTVMPVHTVSDAMPQDVQLRKLRKQNNEVTAQVVNIPTDMAKKLDIGKTLALKYNGIIYNIPPSCFKTQGSCLKLVLPPNTLPHYVCKGGTTNPVSLSVGKPGSNKMTMIQMNESYLGEKLANKENSLNSNPTATKETHVYSRKGGKKQMQIKAPYSGVEAIVIENETELPKAPKGRSRKKKVVSPKAPVARPRASVKTAKYARRPCHFHTLHIGFDAMFAIFEYLKLPDLIRASQVCQTWRKVATQSSLWKHVRLRGHRVTDWHQAIDSFQERNVRALDLRGMKHMNEDGNRTWHELHLHMTSLGCLRHIDFPQCPASVLHAVTEKLGMLKHIAAESIIESVADPLGSCAKLDLGKFAKLTRLEVLKLRGSVGLVQPSFSFSGGLSELSNLKNIHTLSVTTLKDMAGAEFSFLGNLTALHTLSIGDCTLWTPQNFEDIGKLKKLKFLRLESGGNLREATLGKSLVQLTKLESLELFKFMVSFDLADSLQTMAWLRSFSVFSERHAHAAAANSNTMTTLLNMPFLTTIQWGIFDPTADCAGIPSDSIPFLPPADSDQDKRSNSPDTGSNSEHVKVNDLKQRLSSHLSDTIIRVFRVPNVTARRPLPT